MSRNIDLSQVPLSTLLDEIKRRVTSHSNGAPSVSHKPAPPPRASENACGMLVVAGPSGVGKSSILKRVSRMYPNDYIRAVSHTTRKRRNGEMDGVDYHFVSESELHSLMQSERFIAVSRVFGNLYGLRLRDIQRIRDRFAIPYVELTLSGVHDVQQIKELHKGAQYVYVEPTSMEALEARLYGRAGHKDADFVRRIASAGNEIAFARKSEMFDIVIQNETIEQASVELMQFMEERRRRCALQRHEALIANESTQRHEVLIVNESREPPRVMGW